MILRAVPVGTVHKRHKALGPKRDFGFAESVIERYGYVVHVVRVRTLLLGRIPYQGGRSRR